jgi:hypothetical protein
VPEESYLPLADAARVLGMSVDGLRGRVKRGRVESRRDARGHIEVKVSAGSVAVVPAPCTLDEYIQLRESLARLTERAEAKETLIVELREVLARLHHESRVGFDPSRRA